MKNSTNDQLVLVTGGSGFVGSHTILKLLQQGYMVRTTLRSLDRSEEVLEMMRNGNVGAPDRLSFIEADLNNDDNWAEAVDGCTYVLHIASPLPVVEPKDDDEVIIPARDGALRVLNAARDGDVKRVVMTSSYASIGYTIDPKGHVFTEEDWTDPAIPNPAYIRSKTIAERAAWEFINKEGGSLELSVINPVGIFGPALGSDYSLSIHLIKNIIEGEVMDMPDFSFGVIDVRDVADLHIKAMTSPAASGQRFLASADGAVTWYDVAEMITLNRSNRAGKIGIMKPVDRASYIQFSNTKTRSLLNWTPISAEDAILATVDSLPASNRTDQKPL